MKNVAILSNCQSFGLSAATAALLPACDVACFMWNTLNTDDLQRDAIARIGDADLVISDHFGPECGMFSNAGVAQVAKRMLLVPGVLFWGFHPDLTYLPAGHRATRTPLSEYHSIIALAGFLTGRSVAETVDLFNPLVYARLGYFDAYSREIAAICAKYRQEGIDIAPDLERWRALGCFMHSPNHPMPHVLHDVIRAALHAAGIDTDGDTNPAVLPDTLAYLPQFPVYPEIGARLGIAGSLDFQLLGEPGKSPTFIALEDFVEQSFTSYACARPEGLRDAIGIDRALRELRG